MSANTILLLVCAFLLITLLAAVIVLRLDSRHQQLEQRLELAIGAGRGREEPERPVSIRTARSRRPRLSDFLYSILRMPVGLPLANVVPVWLVFLIGIVLGVAATWVTGYLVPSSFTWVVGVVVGFVTARTIFGWETERYREKLLEQLPDAIEVVVSALRAGLPVTESFRGLAGEMPSPTREEFTQMVSEMSLGTPPADAIMNMHHRTLVTEYAMFAVTVAVQMRTGGRLTESVQNLAETVRQRLAVGQRANALSAEAKLSARVISMLPFAGGLLMSLLVPGSMGPLLNEPTGKKMLAVGAVLLVLGMFTMRRLIRGVTTE